jgi:aminopeptidase N
MPEMIRLFCVFLVTVICLPWVSYGLSHDIDISIFPPDRSLLAIDRIRIEPGEFDAGQLRFLINRHLTVEEVRLDSGPAKWYTQEDVDPLLFKADPDSDETGMVRRATGIFIVPDSSYAGGEPLAVTITYSGVVYDSLEAPSKAYAKGFDTTNGLIDDRGVFLSNETLWYPFAFDRMFTFTLRVDTPYDWMAISQGTLESEKETEIHGETRGVTTWKEESPTPEFYLVAGRYFRHEDTCGRTRVMTYTFEESDSLSHVYLDATKRYLSMYGNLIGPYPYTKFALVENFWQTGYGMPSFTLLGSRVIRLPFIVHTSYGHEILHNWWGNSVYVDYDSGNWCEGLTTYGADYLYKELAGEAEARAYRHETLMAFSNNVTRKNDFPLTEFRERHSASSQSVGYGKSLMVFHMLRKALGDSVFWGALQRFYVDNRFRFASWKDLEEAFSDQAGTDLGWYFDQWVTRPGGPAIRLAHAGYQENAGGYVTEIELTQDAPPFAVDLPVVIETKGGTETRLVRLDSTDASYSIETGAEPLTVAVDPDYDTFRLLSPEEIPITMGTLFGRDSVAVVIGNREPEAAKRVFRGIASQWGLGGRVVEETDSTGSLVAGKTMWLMGRGDLSNRLLAGAAESVRISDEAFVVDGQELARPGGTLIVTVKSPLEAGAALGFFISDDMAGAQSLGGRLPHYGKYSYLGFAGGDLVLKGTWKEEAGPLFADLRRR